MAAAASFSYKIGGSGKDLATFTLLAAVLTWSGLEVYRMWDFQYSRIRMRILHFNIRGYRMQILHI